MSANECGNKIFERVAPDGGWGYMIALAVTINLTSLSLFSSLPCFELLFNEYKNDIGMSSTNFTVMNGINAICLAISGYMTGPLLSIISIRNLMLLGVFFFNIGIIGNVFATSVVTLVICQGAMQGIGTGIIYNLSYTIINLYFVKKRLMVISGILTITAIITMVMPILFKWSLEEYGFRSTLLLVSGKTLQCLVGVALIQPIGWHLKKIEIVVGNNGQEISPPLIIDNALEEKPTPQSNKIPGREATTNILNEKPFNFELSEEIEKVDRIKNILNSLFDKKLCEIFLMSCVSMGPALCVFADKKFGEMLPHALYKADWDEDNVTLALLLLNLGDLAMRMMIIFSCKWLMRLGSQELYLIGILIGIVSRLGMLWSKNNVVILIYLFFSGVSHSCIVIFLPIVVANAVPPEKFTAALGVFMLLTGSMSMVLGPAIGAITDLTDSYGAAFYIIVSCFAMTILFWSIEICYKRCEHKRLQRLEYLRLKKLNKG